MLTAQDQRIWKDMVAKSFNPRQWFRDGKPPYQPDDEVGEDKIMWVYRIFAHQSNSFEVGYYDPSGEWHEESNFSCREHAAQRVHYLNGGR